MDEEIVKYGSKALADITEIGKKLAGPLAEEIGLTLGDKAREYRLRNAVKIFGRVKNMLAEAGIKPVAIPPRLFLSAIEAASVEDDETLQAKWAALLTNAADPERRIPVLPSFVEVLQELTPDEARLLEQVYDSVRDPAFPVNTIYGAKIIDSFSDLTLMLVGRSKRIDVTEAEQEYRLLVIDDLIRLGIIWRRDTPPIATSMSRDQFLGATTNFFLTPFGYAFLSACRAPDPIA
jgi:hypothetical protein